MSIDFKKPLMANNDSKIEVKFLGRLTGTSYYIVEVSNTCYMVDSEGYYLFNLKRVYDTPYITNKPEVQYFIAYGPYKSREEMLETAHHFKIENGVITKL
jgi:hypothetical protein